MNPLKLYPHQEKALARLSNGKILNGTVGSGKSLTAITYYYTNVCDGQIAPNFKPIIHGHDLYIITTARKRDTGEWDHELSYFALTTKEEDNKIQPVHVKIDSWNNIEKYVDVERAFFIFDEDRVVGNGSWVKSFLKITKTNKWIILSATPGDKWEDYIPVFIANRFYKNRTEFARRHLVFARFATYPKVIGYMEEEHLESLKRAILIPMDDIRDVDIIEEYVYCKYDKDVYKQVMKEQINLDTGEPFKQASELCYALRKVVNSAPSRCDTVYKLYLISEKAIVFYNFNYELDALKEMCEEKHIPYAEYNGHKHEDIPKDSSWLYLVQYTAGAEGWNCILTDTIIFYSQTYSYKQLTQAKGRINRINTPFHILYYYRLLSSSVIDLSINIALENKRDFNERNFTP